MTTKQKSKMLFDIIIELHIFFDSDKNKVVTWLSTDNLNFGDVSPMFLIENNKIHKVHQYIMEALS